MRQRYVWPCWLAVALSLAGAAGAQWLEPPALRERVAAGELPPIAKRLPKVPSVERFEAPGAVPGRYGGEVRTLASRSRDVRLLVVYGYARLVAYGRDLELEPDLLEAVDVADGGRSFTLHLRPEHRWSDGHPFTSEDFRYYFEDIAGNPSLSPFGFPAALLVDGEPPAFEVLGPTAVRYAWPAPNPVFLASLAAARPQPLYAPAHYLKSFHARYADEKGLEAVVKGERRRNWVALHTDRFRPYRNTNPDLPTLQPWINTTGQPSQRFVFVRNPYYHRVDASGHQLPYIDRVVMNLTDPKLIPLKTSSGESELQARGLKLGDYPFLKEGEERNGFDVRLWETTKGAQIALIPNLNVVDPVWRALLRDVRFRRALSLATNRHEINQIFFFGLAREGNDTVGPSSPLFQERFQTAWAEYDIERANALLDEIGLVSRDRKRYRLLPDGRRLRIIVETAGEDTQQSDILQIVASTWRKVGIELLVKPLQREVFRRRIFAGENVMSVWGGLENGLPTPEMSPHELAPVRQDQYQWPKWGQYHESRGGAGEPVDMPVAEALVGLYEQWEAAASRAEKTDIWRQMLEIRAEQVFTIGIIAGVPQPVVVSRRLRNVPERGIYNWDPGAHFGIHRPDAFWLDEGE